MQALKTWRETTAAERSRILRRWFDLMMANQEDLARLMTAEQGKPLAEVAGRNRLRGGLCRVVRRRSQACLR
jgi:acyl-CoA reductase-like NAD-dependent aldehyde dehydrogenase